MGSVGRSAKAIALGMVAILLYLGLGGCRTVVLEYTDDLDSYDIGALRTAESTLDGMRTHPIVGEEPEMGITDFSSFDLGTGIISYSTEGETGVFMPNGIVMYPIYQRGEVVLTFIAMRTDDDPPGECEHYSLQTEYTEKLNSFLKTNKEAVIISDKDYIVVRSKTQVAILTDKSIYQGGNAPTFDRQHYLIDFDGLTFTKTALIGKIELPVNES